MADETGEDVEVDPKRLGHFGRWLHAEMRARDLTPTSLARLAIDPDSGTSGFSRITVHSWLSKSAVQLKPSSVRALAWLFEVRRDHIRHLEALDLGCADPTPAAHWPPFVHIGMADVSLSGQQLLRGVSDAIVAAEGKGRSGG